MTVLTSGQLTTVRSPNQSTDLYLSVYQPPIVFQAQINDASITKGAVTITYDNIVTPNTWQNIKSGQTLYIGSVSGGKDIGRVRVRSATATTLTVAPDDSIVYTDNLYLTVKDQFQLWGVFPKATLSASNVVTFYKDNDIAYTNQNGTFSPTPIMGCDYAGFNTVTGTVISFNATGSYVIDDTAISSYAWTFPSGCVPSSSTAGNLDVYFPTGVVHSTVSCAITASNGKSWTGYRHVSLYNRFGSDNIPIFDWVLKDITGDWESGWIAKIEVGQSANLFDDDALVIIFADDYYNNTLQSFGGFLNREHIVFVGFVNKEDTFYNFETSKTTIYVKGMSGLLQNKEMFSVSLESSSSPADWTQMNNMTINKIMDHYLRWHTTLLSIADYTKIPHASADYPEQFEDITKGEILSNLNNMLRSRLVGNFTSDKQSRCFAEVNLNCLPTGSRAASAMTFLSTDWVDKIQFDEMIDTPVSSVLMGGVSYDYALNSGTALLSRAPGNDPTYRGKNDTFSGLTLTSQSQLNELSGLYFAKQNNRFGKLEVDLANNMRNIDIIPQEFYNFNLTSSDTFRDITWNNKRFIPRQIKYTHQNGFLRQNIVFEGETSGGNGDTVIIPVTPPNTRSTRPNRRISTQRSPSGTTGSGAGVSVPPSSSGSTNLVYAASSTHMCRTRNFMSATPNWINVTASITGTIKYFALDPYNPKDKATVVTTTGIWTTSNLDAISVLWTNGQSASQFNTATGKTLLYYNSVRYTIAQQNVFFVQAITSDNYLYVGSTTTNGASWVWKQIGTTTANVPLGFWTSQHVVNKTWTTCGNGELWTSSNSISNPPTYTLTSTTAGASPLCNIHVPYDNNVNDQIIWIGGNGATLLSRYDSNNGWTSVGLLPVLQNNTLTDCGYASQAEYTPQFTTPYGSDTYEFTSTSTRSLIVDFGVIQPAGALLYLRLSANNISSWGATYDRSVDNITYIGQAAIGGTMSTCSVGTSTAIDIATYRYVKLEVASPTREINFFYGYISDGYKGSNYIHKSTDGGSSFTDVTPVSKGAIGYNGINIWTQDVQRAMAFLGTTTSSMDLMESLNSGSTWTVKQSGLATPVSIGRYPYTTQGLYMLQGASTNRINYSADDGASLLNKTNDWASATGVSFSNPVEIVPVWTVN